VADAAGLGGSVLSSFGPTIDEEVVFSDYDHRARKGQFIQRPLLIGNNNYEAGFFKIVTALSGARSGISLNPPDFYWEAFQKVTFECATAHRAYYHVQAGLPVGDTATSANSQISRSAWYQAPAHTTVANSQCYLTCLAGSVRAHRPS
jgi:hypothetical protein